MNGDGKWELKEVELAYHLSPMFGFVLDEHKDELNWGPSRMEMYEPRRYLISNLHRV